MKERGEELGCREARRRYERYGAVRADDARRLEGRYGGEWARVEDEEILEMCRGEFEDGRGGGWDDMKNRRERLWNVDSYEGAKKYLDRMGFVVEPGELDFAALYPELDAAWKEAEGWRVRLEALVNLDEVEAEEGEGKDMSEDTRNLWEEVKRKKGAAKEALKEAESGGTGAPDRLKATLDGLKPHTSKDLERAHKAMLAEDSDRKDLLAARLEGATALDIVNALHFCEGEGVKWALKVLLVKAKAREAGVRVKVKVVKELWEKRRGGEEEEWLKGMLEEAERARAVCRDAKDWEAAKATLASLRVAVDDEDQLEMSHRAKSWKEEWSGNAGKDMSLEELEAAVQGGSGIVGCEELDEMADRLEKAESWSSRVTQLTGRVTRIKGKSSTTLSELVSLQTGVPGVSGLDLSRVESLYRKVKEAEEVRMRNERGNIQ